MTDAEKKVQIAIDKMIDLQQDFKLTDSLYSKVQRVLDSLNELEAEVALEKIKRKN